MEEGYKWVDKKSKTYYVFKTTTGLYFPEELCLENDVGNKNKIKLIKDKICYKVSNEDITKIKLSSDANVEYEMIFDLQLVLTFSVLVDKNHDNKLYITNNLCEKYKIKPISKRIIEGSTYCNVTEGDIDMIEEMTKDDKIILKKDYVEKELDDEVKPAEQLFIYYYCIEDKKNYVQRDILELAKKNDIEIEASPKIVESKNCYSITDDEIKEIEKKTGYHGVEKMVKPKQLLKLVDEKLDAPKIEENPIPFSTYKPINAFSKSNDKNIALYKDIHSRRIFANQYAITRFNIEINDDDVVVVNNEQCYEITRDDALFIVNNANNNYSPYSVSYDDMPLGLNDKNIRTLVIYKDITSKKTFVKKYVIKRFNLELTSSTIDVDGETCYEIKYDDAAFIIKASNNTYSPYIVKIEDLPLGIDSTNPTSTLNEEYYNMSYNDAISKIKDEIKPYNNDDILLHNKPEEQSEVAPLIPDEEIVINNEIESTQDEVAPIQQDGPMFDLINTIGELSTINKEQNNEPIEKETPNESKEELPFSSEVAPTTVSNPFTDIVPNSILTNDTIETEESTPEEESIDRISKLNVSATYLDKNDGEVKQTVPQEKIVIYKDTTSGKLYVPEDCTFNPSTKTKKIMNRVCYETSEEELERIFNKVFIISDVFPSEKSTIDVIVCNNNGKLFVSKQTLNTLNFYIENPHRIKVNKEIFEEITPDDVDLIRERETDEIAINIIFKHITPTKK